jgi:RimJ/RimL family protein N-acetyltransferase
MIPTLYSERLLYKPVTDEHCTMTYVNWLNDYEVYKYMETGGNYTMEMLIDYIKGVKAQKELLFWAIHIKGSNKHIGNIKIDPINKRHGLGEYGIMLGDRSEWGKGYGKEASLRIIQYCFEEVKLRKITLGVVADNLTAVELYKKIGFMTEGVYKKHCFYDGHYCDSYRMAIFNPIFENG